MEAATGSVFTCGAFLEDCGTYLTSLVMQIEYHPWIPIKKYFTLNIYNSFAI